MGNDYIVMAAEQLDFKLTPARAQALCDRHFGIGSDGILLWQSSDRADFHLDIFNPDGSMAEMCGNGIRMLACCLYQHGHIDRPTFTVATGAGIITPTVEADGRVRVHMGQARLGGPGIQGFSGEGPDEAINQTLEASGRPFPFTFVSMGNPHCVIEHDGSLTELDLERWGRAIEHHQLFPNRANVEFIKVLGPNEVEMRVWERGVGETLACGTGACAVAVTACRTKGVGSPVTVHLPGGDLQIEVTSEMEVFMTGPAEEVYAGVLSDGFINLIKEL